MIAERIAHKARRDLYRRILCLSQDEAARVIEFIDALACPEMYRAHIPNEETVRAIEESYDPANLTGPYATAEAMIKDMLAAQDA